MAISSQPETGRLDISASAGAYRTAEFQIVNASGTAVTGWTGADDPEIEVWTGDDREALTGTGLSAAWSSDTSGTVTIETDGTHTLTPATYQWRMLATSAGKTYEICRGNYTIQTAPGTVDLDPTAAESPYTTIDDLLTLAPWVTTLQGGSDRTGFAEHQEAARQWFDGLILACWRNANGYFSEYPYPTRGPSVDYPPEWLRDVLATGEGVQVTPKIKRACAAYALASICAAQLTMTEADSGYRLKAAQFRSMAKNEAVSMTVFIKSSTTATTYDIPVNLGIGARN